MHTVDLAPAEPASLVSVLDERRREGFIEDIESAARSMTERTLWHVNSTDQGGGVAEMLQSLLPYLAAYGIDTRWLVVDGNDEFFRITKQIHHLLHGSDADGRDLSGADREAYEATLRTNADGLGGIAAGDIAILHDPQTAGLAPILSDAGCHVIWACHIGADTPDERVRTAWDFLLPYVAKTDAQVFSRSAYIWEGLDRARVSIIPPCIDANSVKNQAMDRETTSAILATAGVLNEATSENPRFERQDGTDGLVTRRARMIEDGPMDPARPIVTQVSRWDPLKDMRGVLDGFVGHVSAESGAQLVLAGPAPDSVADDPESLEVFEEVHASWERLPPAERGRVHLACLPMDDLEENAAMVNALQRRADVVAQKSLAEGFGLTVAEAMWKSKPVVGSRVGGIQDQIVHGESGLLVDDPADLAAFGKAVNDLVVDPDRATRLGRAAHERALEEFLAPRYLARTMDLVQRVIG